MRERYRSLHALLGHHLFVERCVRAANSNALPCSGVVPEFVIGTRHAVFAATLRYAVNQLRKFSGNHIRNLVNCRAQIIEHADLLYLGVVGIGFGQTQPLWIAVDAIYHVQYGRLTGARLGVHHVDNRPTLSGEAQERRTEGGGCCERMPLKARTSVQVEHFAPLLQ